MLPLHLFKIILLLSLFTIATSKSISDQNSKNLAESNVETIKNSKKESNLTKHVSENEQASKEFKNSAEKTKEVDGNTTNGEQTNQTQHLDKPTNHSQDQKALNPIRSSEHVDNTRNSRTIGQLREVESPAVLIENFRQKLKIARNNLEESLAARKANQPKLFMFDPVNKIKPAVLPTLSTFSLARNNQNDPNTPTKPSEGQQIITSPIKDDNSSSSEEKPTLAQDISPKNNSSEEKNDDIKHLLHVRDEIAKIRQMMQTLREQQLKQQFGAQFPHNRNLTEDETNKLSSAIDDLKEQGKISTSPLNSENQTDDEFQKHPPETTKLIEDIRKLKESVLNFAKHVNGPQSNISDLEKQLKEQRQEIDNLKRLVDVLQPPRHFPINPTQIKHPQNVKNNLHQELKTLQDILNDLMKKEETDKVQLRSAAGDTQPTRTEDEINTLMKIIHSLAHPRFDSRTSAVLESKIEKLERELKELDNENKHTRHSMNFQKLEHDLKSLKSARNSLNSQESLRRHLEDSLGHNSRLRSASKFSNMEFTKMNKPTSRSMDIPGNIEKELDNLQREIDLLTIKNLEKSHTPMNSRQLGGLLTDILNTNTDDSVPSATISKIKALQVPSSKVNVVKEQEIKPIESPKIQYSNQPIFQLPFCLQKYPHTINIPQTQPYPPAVPTIPANTDKQQNQQPYEQKINERPMKSLAEYSQDNKQPVKSDAQYKPVENGEYKPYEQPMKSLAGYNQENKQENKPIKIEEEFNKNFEPIKSDKGYSQEYKPVKSIGGYTQEQKPQNYEDKKETQLYGQEMYHPTIYNKEPNKPIQIQEPQFTPHIYQPHLPQISNVHIHYQPETNDGYGYLEEPYKPPCHHDANIDEEMNHLNGMIGNLDEKIDYNHDMNQDYDVYRSKNYKPRNKRALENDHDKKLIYTDLQNRIESLRQAINNQDFENEFSSDFQRSAYAPEVYDNKETYGIVKPFRKQKFDNLFIKIVKFVLHKLEISAPYIVDSLFNGEAFEYDDSNYKYNQRSRDAEESEEVDDGEEPLNRGIFNNFQGFHGLLGFIPTILFKLLSNFSSFLSILKRNQFFKNFLFPGALILAVDGIIGLLVWWFSTDENHNILTFRNSSNHLY